MRRFELIEPRSIDEACQVLAQREDAKIIAGGTALLILIKQGIFVPAVLVNLKKIRGAGGISYNPQDGLRVGALASIYDLESNPIVRQHYPILNFVCHLVANVRIRNMATIGGNLAHADYQSDPPAVLVALDASVELTGHKGNRQLKLTDFLLDSYETALIPGELLSAVLVPPLMPDVKGTYLKFTTRSSEDRPCTSVVAMMRLKDGVCEEACLVVGAVSPTPVRVQKAEEVARGERVTSTLIETMSVEASRAIEPIEDLRGSADYKRHLVRVLTRRALTALTKKGEEA